ncbi:unnamed protein product [Clonostachys rhizophaga]|uniref:Vacuolar membrane PQ loop repeat protein n=1 Tax=Clonostachys rhizophaga TaxID=160324 RepID=A0A9N9V7R9_9HYPO|nr:unnamed protein product [Clonostachys rhizophaga]
MASFLVSAALSATTHPPPLSEAISGIFGSISLVAWICVIAQSADGLSMMFLVVWVLGDATNLLGMLSAILLITNLSNPIVFLPIAADPSAKSLGAYRGCAIFTHLAPTAIILPSYFVFADLVLILQCVYYNTRNKRRASHSHRAEVARASEESPLLRRESGYEAHAEPTRKHSRDETESEPASQWGSNIASLVAVYVVGIAAWFISYKAGAWDSGDDKTPSPDDEGQSPLEIAGLTLGYISAVFYLCARIPQILKNYREKSCEGLAILFFMLSLTGNLTYGISLVAYSQEKKYLLNALPFLIGSIGTIVEDCIIFVQFQLYSGGKRPHAVSQ